jgi:hypothetical protein
MAKQTVITAEMLKGLTKAEIIALVIALNGKSAPVAPKAAPKAKPTLKEALAASAEKHNRNEATIAAYKAIHEANFATDWAIWQASPERNALKGAKRTEANSKKNAELVRKYQNLAGMKY